MITVTVHLNYHIISCWRVKWRNYSQPRVLTNLCNVIQVFDQIQPNASEQQDNLNVHLRTPVNRPIKLFYLLDNTFLLLTRQFLSSHCLHRYF